MEGQILSKCDQPFYSRIHKKVRTLQLNLGNKGNKLIVFSTGGMFYASAFPDLAVLKLWSCYNERDATVESN